MNLPEAIERVEAMQFRSDVYVEPKDNAAILTLLSHAKHCMPKPVIGIRRERKGYSVLVNGVRVYWDDRRRWVDDVIVNLQEALTQGATKGGHP